MCLSIGDTKNEGCIDRARLRFDCVPGDDTVAATPRSYMFYRRREEIHPDFVRYDVKKS